MKHSLIEIKKHFLPISVDQQSAIKGGTGTPLTPAQLEQLFDYSKLAPTGETGAKAQTDGFNSVIGQAFNKEIQVLYTTSLGYDVLSSLLTQAQGNEALHQIVLTPTIPPAGIYAQYNNNANSFLLGNLTNANLTNNVTDVAAFQGIVHEIWHAFQSNVLNMVTADNSSNEDTVEIDAYLFAAMVDMQADKLNPGKNYYYYGTEGWIDHTANIYYKSSWNDILNGNFDTVNYNNLISGFISSDFNGYGSANPNAAHPYNTMKTDHVTSVTRSNNYLYYLYVKDFIPPLTSSGSGTGGGTGGTPPPPPPIITNYTIPTGGAPTVTPITNETPTEPAPTTTAPTTTGSSGTGTGGTNSGNADVIWWKNSEGDYQSTVPGQSPLPGYTFYSGDQSVANAYGSAAGQASALGATQEQINAVSEQAVLAAQAAEAQGMTGSQATNAAQTATSQALYDIGCTNTPPPATPPPTNTGTNTPTEQQYYDEYDYEYDNYGYDYEAYFE